MEVLAKIFSPGVVVTALETGCIFALVALALFISYTTLNIADLSTDGCFTLGCAVSCMVTISLSQNPAMAPTAPFLALLAAMGAGVCSGFVTAFLQTRLGVESIMAGIVVNTGLYTVNIAVMGFASQLSLLKTETIFSKFESLFPKTKVDYPGLALSALFVLVACLLVTLFMGTRLGLSIRATGDNADMVRASSINPAFTITVGLCIANALTGLAGGLLAQYQKSADINVGTGTVTAALASLIIGETIIGKGGIVRHMIGVVVGSCIYRLAIAAALGFNLPAAALKLVSALIVAIAISMPAIKRYLAFQKRRAAGHAAKGGNV